MISGCAGVDLIILWVDSIHTLLHLKVRFIQMSNEMYLYQLIQNILRVINL